MFWLDAQAIICLTWEGTWGEDITGCMDPWYHVVSPSLAIFAFEATGKIPFHFNPRYEGKKTHALNSRNNWNLMADGEIAGNATLRGCIKLMWAWNGINIDRQHRQGNGGQQDSRARESVIQRCFIWLDRVAREMTFQAPV